MKSAFASKPGVRSMLLQGEAEPQQLSERSAPPMNIAGGDRAHDVMSSSTNEGNVPHVSGGLQSLLVPANRFSYFLRRKRQLQGWAIRGPVWVTAGCIDETALRLALGHLYARHDGLRLQGCKTALGWTEFLSLPDTDACILVKNVAQDDPKAQTEILSEWILHVMLAIRFPGPLIRVATGNLGIDRSYVCLLAHHLVLDDMSFRMALDELLSLYQAIRRKVALPPALETCSWVEYVCRSRLHWLAQAPTLTTEWLNLPWHSSAKLQPTRARDEAACFERFTMQHTWRVPIEDVKVLERKVSLAGSSVSELVLMAVTQAFCTWTGHAAVNLALVINGRDGSAGLGQRHTLGWISEAVPMLLQPYANLYEGVHAFRRSLLWTVRKGKSHGILRYLSPDASTRKQLSQITLPEISLNIKLRQESAFSACLPLQVNASALCPEASRVFLLSGGAFIRDGALCIAWDFSHRVFDSEDVCEFTRLCATHLCQIIFKMTGLGLLPGPDLTSASAEQRL